MKKYLPHLLAVLFFLAVSYFVFQPIFQGKELKQTDVTTWEGMAHELIEFKEKTGEQSLWTNSMFGGMPAYQITATYPANLIRYVNQIVLLGLPSPANYVWLYMIGFYFLLLVLGVDKRVSILGAVAFAFSSYFFIFIEAGHNTKAHAIGFMAPVLAGVLLAYRGRMWLGAAVTGISLALELYANHLQITYYLAMMIVLLGLAEFYTAIREKKLPAFVKTTMVLLVAVALAVGSNITNLLVTQEYGKYSTRGPSELTSDKENKTSGLDRDYITSWSFGKSETFTLLIPSFKGGASEPISKNHKDALKEVDSNFRQNVGSFGAYFGEQPFTSGPVYVGAIIVLFFIIGLFVIKGPMKWWLLSATILSLMLSWGRHFMDFTNLFLDFVPGYDKFRSVTTIIVIAELAIPLLAILTVDKMLREADFWKQNGRKVFYGMAAVIGLTLLIAVTPGTFTSFYTPEEYDQVLQSVQGQNISQDVIDSFFQAVTTARKAIVSQDAFRSLLFLLLGSLLTWSFLRFRYRKEIFIYGLLFLVMIDLGVVNARYLGSDDYVRKQEKRIPFPETNADRLIRQDTTSYRVLNLAVNTFNDASTAYYHQSIGGYHGAKLKRYQELIENHIAVEVAAMRLAMQQNDSSLMQMMTGQNVLNMLNTKYIIYNPEAAPFVNYGSLGNAWFVPEYKIVANSDSEIAALASLDPTAAMLVDKRYEEQLKGYQFQPDSTATIALTSYRPNHLTYSYSSNAERLTVFSEIYYDKGWDAYIDGKEAPYFRTNYVLRGMRLPAGKHTVEFKFEPKSYATGESIALASSALLLVFAAGFGFLEYRRSKSA